jgi:DNA-directed RNA polymerase subunit RPC12/RpoP
VASCVSCDNLKVVGRCDDGRVLVRCSRDENRTVFPTGLSWMDLSPELRSACADHHRYCAHCGAKLEGEVAKSRASFCPDCRAVKRRVDIGLAPVSDLFTVAVRVSARAAAI